MVSRSRVRAESAVFRNYVADSLYAMSQGMSLTMRLSDVTGPGATREEIDVDKIIDHVESMIGGEK